MKYLIKKIITLIITLLLISILTFTAFSVIPGDAAITRLGTSATPEQVEEMREAMGLNDPLPVRYGKWLSGAVRGDFGQSYSHAGTSVASLVGSRMTTTVILAIMSLVMILAASLPLGVIAAKHQGGVTDVIITNAGQLLMAIPGFLLGIFITFIFGIILHIFSPGAFVSPSENIGRCIIYLIFPAIAVAIPKIAMVSRFLRNSILAESKKDYVRTAFSKGNDENRVLIRHILKNAMIPVITFIAMVIAEILAGSIIVEQVFSVQGVGNLLVTSISTRDFPVVSAIVLYIAAIVIIINFIVDIIYKLVDPRVKA